MSDQQAALVLRYTQILDEVELRLMENASEPTSNKGLADLTEAIRKAFDMKRELTGILTEAQLQTRERNAIYR